MGADTERLARLEEKLDSLKSLLERVLDDQEEKNGMFFEVRDRVNSIEATSRGAWKTLAILGTVSAMLGATFAWVVEHPPSFTHPSVEQTIHKNH